jgi:NDP-sugar pyrophosphorylase family protein
MLNIIVPMAGNGKRFKDIGITTPKPFIEVGGKRMIDRAIDPFLQLKNTKFIFLCKREHEPYASTLPGDVIYVEKTTEGSACTVLLAEEKISNGVDPILVMNCDQVIEFNLFNFVTLMHRADGIIFTFKPAVLDKKWSYARLGDENKVVEVAEKNAISDVATCGLYFWHHFNTYKFFANQMIHKNVRVNGEFYSCPVYQQAIDDNRTILPFMVEKMIGLGDPESIAENLYLLEEYQYGK